MHKKNFMCRIIVLTGLMVYSLGVQAASYLTEDQVEAFRFKCLANTDYDISLQFAPVEKLADRPADSEDWSYRFVTDDRRYPDNKIVLPRNRAARVDLVLQLNQTNSYIQESYLWAVIVAPAVTGWKYGGHWPASHDLSDYSRLTAKRESLATMARSLDYGGEPVHSKIPVNNIDLSEDLNQAWKNLFGGDVIDLVYTATRGARTRHRGYAVNFYYVPTPALNLINPNGYKWPSFKHVDKPGNVYAFALTPAGECLEWTSIAVVKQQ